MSEPEPDPTQAGALDAFLAPVLGALEAAVALLPRAGLPTERVRAAVEAWLSTRGKLPRRERVPPWFWVVVAFHVGLGALMMAHPLLVPRQLDGWVCLVLLGIVLHWALFCGECIVSVLEKKAFYTGYTLGAHPLHQWYMDVFTARQCVGIAATIGVAWLVSLATLVARNVVCQGWEGVGQGGPETAWRLMFGGTGHAFVVGMRRAVTATQDVESQLFWGFKSDAAATTLYSNALRG